MAPMPETSPIDPRVLLDMVRSGETDLICILGPTACGKTRYAVELCRKFNSLSSGADILPERTLAPEKGGDPLRGEDPRGQMSAPEDTLTERTLPPEKGGDPLCGEDPRGQMSAPEDTLTEKGAGKAEIISGDSRQVYRGMDIGTGKDLEEYGEIPCHLIDIADPGTRYTVYDYQRDFEAAYKDICSRGGIPVLCGGSGLYVQAATCGYQLTNVPPDPGFRAAMEAEDPAELRRRLLEIKPDTPEGTLQSTRRVIRALEIARYERQHPVQHSNSLPKKTFYIGILATREERVERIDRRLDERLASGLIEEVRGLLARGIAPEDLIYYGLEYKFVTQYVLGILTYEQMRTLLANAIHQFAKRQMTWLRGMEKDGIEIHWTRP